MPLKLSESDDILTRAEVKEIQTALVASGGMLVVPLKNGRRLTPHLIPLKQSGLVDQHALDLLVRRLRIIGCETVVGVPASGRCRNLVLP